MLQPEDDVQEQRADKPKKGKAGGVFNERHLAMAVDSRDAIDELFGREKPAIQCCALGRKNSFHVSTERFDKASDDRQK